MLISIRTEEERNKEVLNFINEQIEELERNINSCDYVEDIDGNLQYLPDSYLDEKRQYDYMLRKWKILLTMISSNLPLTMFDW